MRRHPVYRVHRFKSNSISRVSYHAVRSRLPRTVSNIECGILGVIAVWVVGASSKSWTGNNSIFEHLLSRQNAACCDSNLTLALKDVAKVRCFSVIRREPQPLLIQVHVARELDCYLCCRCSVWHFWKASHSFEHGAIWPSCRFMHSDITW
jgi:hypothetical protein